MRFYDNKGEEHDTIIGATLKSGMNNVGAAISGTRVYKNVSSAMNSMYNRYMYGYDVYEADEYEDADVRDY